MGRPHQQFLTKPQMIGLACLMKGITQPAEIAKRAGVTRECARLWTKRGLVHECWARYQKTGRIFPLPRHKTEEEKVIFESDMAVLRRFDQLMDRYGPTGTDWQRDFAGAQRRFQALAKLAREGMEVGDLEEPNSLRTSALGSCAAQASED